MGMHKGGGGGGGGGRGRGGNGRRDHNKEDPDSSFGNQPYVSPISWTEQSLQSWEEGDLDLPPEVDWPFQPPKEPSSSKWYKYFKVVEDWLISVQQEYSELKGLFYNYAPGIVHASMELVIAAEYVLDFDKDRFFKREVDKRMWTRGVQEVVGVFRHSKAGTPIEALFKTKIYNRYLLKMIRVYERLLKKTESLSSFDVSICNNRQGFLILPGEEGTMVGIEEKDKNKDIDELMVDLIYRLRIYIGDMYRYSTPEGIQFERAYEHYDIARFVRRNQGRAYYQLGVLCAKSDAAINAMFYFLRAFLVPSPVERAKQEALEIHARAFEIWIRNKPQYWYSLSKVQEDNVKWKNKWFTQKQWILPAPFGKTKSPRFPQIPPPSKEEHVQSLPTKELYKRFSVTLTLAVGKLVSRVGMDEFEEVAEECLVYFEGLLNRKNSKNQNSSVISFNVMMGVVGLIIDALAIIVQARRNASASGQNVDQLKLDLKLGVLFSLELFSVSVERMSKLIFLMDWENPLLYVLSSAVWVWCTWLAENIKCWAIPHVRPRFAIRRIERSRNLNRSDVTDDVWTSFAELMTHLNNLMFCVEARRCSFPRLNLFDTFDPSEKLDKLPPLPEYLALGGLMNTMENGWYRVAVMVKAGSDMTRGHLFHRLGAIHACGDLVLKQHLQYLDITGEGAMRKYVVTKKANLIMPKELKDSCGLHERMYWFWVKNLDRVRLEEEAEEAERRRSRKRRGLPDCSGSSIIVRKKGSPLYRPSSSGGFRRPQEFLLPVTFINKIWSAFDDHGYRCEMIVYARWVLVDTNCFIGKLDFVKKLVQALPYPILIPITVCLELRGLSKGGMKLRFRDNYADADLASEEAIEKIKHGNEVAIFSKEALDFIESNIERFQLVSSRGRIFKVSSIFDRVRDENFDKNQRNDNRILSTCVYLEYHDAPFRKLDTPLRLYRRSVLVTGDRGLRVKSITHEIPTVSIESFTYWVAEYYKPPPKQGRGRGRRGGSKGGKSK